MNFTFQVYDSPVGKLYLIAKEDSLYGVVYAFSWMRIQKEIPSIEEKEVPILAEAKKQLGEYFKGMRKEFDLPYQLEGTPFQIQVWSALSKIPFGTTRTYKEQAISINAPQAVRAVGRTNGRNLLSIVLPCHRVVGSNGTLTGYAGGLAAKQYLLKLEGALS